MKKAIKMYRKSVESWEWNDIVQKNFVTVCSTIDKAARKNLIHKKNAARKKSRLSKLAVAA
jgi:ribosomal protein S20